MSGNDTERPRPVSEEPGIDISALYELRLRTPRLELRLPTDDELVELGHLAEEGIHPPEFMPFAVPWTDAIGTPGFLDEFLAYHRGCRENWRPEEWRLNFGTWAEGELAGTQGVEAEDFATKREVLTGSWLGQRFQGRGYGTEQRAAVLALAFDGLGARAANSGAVEGNVASERVSEKLGYERAGEEYRQVRGAPVREEKFRLSPERWQAPVAVEIEGLEPCLHLFGVR